MYTKYVKETAKMEPYPYSLEITRYTDGDVVISILDNNGKQVNNADDNYVCFEQEKLKELIGVLQSMLEEN